MTQLLVITKAPVPGRSKTRLTPPCTPEQAAAIASAAVGDTLDVVRAAPVQRRVVALDGAPGGLDLSGCVVVPQA
ncbi:glycosyltransferase, partial [Modestobacter sp. VKM Ac-2676]